MTETPSRRSIRPIPLQAFLWSISLALAAVLALAPRPARSEPPVKSESPDRGPAEGVEAVEGPDPYDRIANIRTISPAWDDATPVAWVGKDTVTAGDFYYTLDQGEGIDRTAPPDSLRRSLLEKVINQRLLVQEAYRRRLERDPRVVNEVNRIKDRLVNEELRRRIYLPKVDVTEDEIRQIYDRYHYTLRAHHLTVDRRDLAEDLLRRLKAGEDFGELARRYSQDKNSAEKGGDLGELGGGDLQIDFEDVIFKLEPGDLSEVIRATGENYKIFRLDNKVRDREPPRALDEMRMALATKVRIRESGAAKYAWEQSLFEKYDLEINEENFQRFMHRLRDQIASWEAVNAVKRDSLGTGWIFTGWSPDDLALELATFHGGRLIVGEFHKAYRDRAICPTCLWRDSDIQLRQFVRGLAFDNLVILETRDIRAERLPSLEAERARRQENVMAQVALADLTVQAEAVSDEDARAFWEGHKQEYKDPPRAKVRRIVVDSEEQARDILKRLEGGADFAALAERFSKDEATNRRGGETNFFGPGSMEGMSDVALAHQPGELIPPFRSQKGWEVVVVMEKIPEGLKTFEAVKTAVKQRIAIDRTNAKVEERIDGLRRSTSIRIDEASLARMAVSS